MLEFSDIGDVPLLVAHSVAFWAVLHLCLVPVGLAKRFLYVGKGKS